MGRGRNRKPRNFATFRFCPRPGAADASNRVFVRVDDNPYSVPGFADDGGSSSSATVGGRDDPSSSSSAADGGGALPEHVRREIMEFGLPDDGYDYLAHLRELRPSISSTGGGGSSAVFLPSRRRPARPSLPVDVKAYDLSRVTIASGEVAQTATAARRVEEAIDLDVANLLQGSDLPAVESGGEDLEEDFVVLANHPEEEHRLEEEEKNVGVVDDDEEDELEGGRGKERAEPLPREQFDSLSLEEYADGEDGCHVRDFDHELSHEVVDELKLPQSENFDADQKLRAAQHITSRTLESSTKKQIGASSNAIFKCDGYAERYELREEEQAVLVGESSDRSAVGYCATAVSRSYLDLHPGKTTIPDVGKKKILPGETSLKKAIIKKGMEKLLTEYLPQRKTSSGETLKQGP